MSLFDGSYISKRILHFKSVNIEDTLMYAILRPVRLHPYTYMEVVVFISATYMFQPLIT